MYYKLNDSMIESLTLEAVVFQPSQIKFFLYNNLDRLESRTLLSNWEKTYTKSQAKRGHSTKGSGISTCTAPLLSCVGCSGPI